MTLDQLNYLLVLSEEQNVTRAAQRLYITQPTLTTFITKLEKELGTKLFDRTRNPVRTTENGKLYIQKMRELLLAEQHRDGRARALASEHFLNRLERIFAHVFEGMMERGLLKRCDPQLLALAYATPISVLIMERDRYPEREPEIAERIRMFMVDFVGVEVGDAHLAHLGMIELYEFQLLAQ